MKKIIDGIQPLNEKAMKEASQYLDTLVKPVGSLGRLEDIAIQIAGITGKVYGNKTDKKIHFVFGADNGICDEGVSSAPQEFTYGLMSYYLNKDKAGIVVLTDMVDAELKVIDMGVKGELSHPDLISRKLMNGTNNFAKEPAIPVDVVYNAIDVGVEMAKYAYDHGYQIIGTGEVGMGNTSTSSACIMSALNLSVDEAVSRGAGLLDDAYDHKKKVINDAVLMHKPNSNDPIDILSKVGGLDICGLVGLYLGAAYYKIPIIIDGVISCAAALLAYKFNPLTKEYMIPSHISEEKAYKKAIEYMEIDPILFLKMRLGEGTGCPFAMQIVDASLKLINEMLSFSNAIDLDGEEYMEKSTEKEVKL